MSASASPVDAPLDANAALQRKFVALLAVTVAVGGIGVSSGIALGSVLAEDLGGSVALAGLATTMSVLGAAAMSVPMARLAERSGRRTALMLGYSLGMIGALGVLVSATFRIFPVYLVAMALFGGGTASGLQSRYAATDAAAPSRVGRDLSIVVWAVTLGSVLGPNLTPLGQRFGHLFGIPDLAGPFLFSVAAFASVILMLWLGLRPDPLDVARAKQPKLERLAMRQVLGQLWQLPRASWAMTAMFSAHAVMVGVMVMTPVHIMHHGGTIQVVGLVISMHIAGMYALSPVMGWLTDRFGAPATVVLGVLILLVSLLLSGTSGEDDIPQLIAGLTLLGVGWSACTVAGSSMLTTSVPEDIRPSAQGSGDALMGFVGAGAGLGAGPLMSLNGYPFLSAAAALLLLPVAVMWLRVQRSAKSNF